MKPRIVQGVRGVVSAGVAGRHGRDLCRSCVDESGRLALDALPITSPPRDTYEDVVLSDKPARIGGSTMTLRR